MGRRRRGATRRLRGAGREAHAREVLGRWRASEETQADFCGAEGIAPNTLMRWRREFGDGEPGGEPRDRFVRVELGERRSDGWFEIELPSGTGVRVPFGFDAGDLTRLLAVVARC